MTRAEQKAATRVRLMRAAEECFEAGGYEGATMRDIAAAANTSTGAAFNIWPSKHELHADVYGRNATAWRVAEAAVTASGKSWADMPTTERTFVASLAVIMLRDAGTLVR